MLNNFLLDGREKTSRQCIAQADDCMGHIGSTVKKETHTFNSVAFCFTSLSSKFRFSCPWSMWWSEIRKKRPKFFGPNLKILFYFCFICVYLLFFSCTSATYIFSSCFEKTEILHQILYPTNSQYLRDIFNTSNYAVYHHAYYCSHFYSFLPSIMFPHSVHIVSPDALSDIKDSGFWKLDDNNIIRCVLRKIISCFQNVRTSVQSYRVQFMQIFDANNSN